MKAPEQFLFAADLDGTLLPNATKRAADGCLERTRSLLENLKAWDCPVAYISGRHLSLARVGQRTFRLPSPDHWVCNVGTEIYDAAANPDQDWSRSLGPTFDRLQLLGALRSIPHLTSQEAAKQGPHKLSFFYPQPASSALKAQILDCAKRLRANIRLIDSVEESSGRALLDIVPEAAGKAPALHYLAGKYGMADDHVFFAGDSGNDLDALASGVCGNLVGNAPEAVREDAQDMLTALPHARIYLSEQYYGDGVIEALKAYRLVTSDS